MAITTTARHAVVPIRRHAMPRPRHSALLWAAHLGGACAWAALIVGVLVYTTTSTRVGQTIFSTGVLGILISGGFAVAGSQRHRRR